MANIIITNACNADCPFCFAKDLRQEPITHLSLEDLDTRIAFVVNSGLSQIRLTGGEPTLHPQFREIISRIMSTGLILVMFSNGKINEKVLRDLIQLPSHKLAILMNANAMTDLPDNMDSRSQVFNGLKDKITLGYTIIEPIFNLTLYFQWIMDFGLQKKLRLGLAQPILWGDNRFLSPKKYKQVGQSILINAEKAYCDGIQLEFDCGFVRCMFSEQEWHRLADLGVVANSHCAPNLDITIDGSIVHCFSIRQFATKLNKTTTTKKAYDEIMNQRKFFRTSGIFTQCADCEERINGRCCAGCLSITLRRFHNLTQRSFNQFSKFTPNNILGE
jgi:MoaA/NifB/PqqE/SkfB family radical SAM enzyme